MRKFLVLLLLMSSASYAEYNCTITSVPSYSLGDDYEINVQGTTYYEEGYSTSIEVNKEGFLQDFYIGNKRFDYSQQINLDETDRKIMVDLEDKKNNRVLSFLLNKETNLGRITISGENKVLAMFDCNNYGANESAVKNSSEDQWVKIEHSKLPARVKAAMFDIDTVLELGDGYYDVTDSNLYQVLDDHGKLLGYVYVYEMYYTEDDEEFTHYDYHYPNGVRFDSDAWNY